MILSQRQWLNSRGKDMDDLWSRMNEEPKWVEEYRLDDKRHKELESILNELIETIELMKEKKKEHILIQNENEISLFHWLGMFYCRQKY